MWHMENLNSVATAVIDSITIESANDYPTRDIKVACMTRGASGTPISTVERTIYNIVPAKGTATFRNVVLGPINSQSDSMECLLD